MAIADAFETAFVKIGADTSALIKGIQDIPGQLAAIQGSLDAKLAGITDALGVKADSALKKLGTSISGFGAVWSGAVSLPITAAGVGIAKFGGDFEAAMSRVQVLGEVGREDLKKLTDQAIELGIKTPFSAKAAADAMGEFAAQGFKANEIMGAMPGILGLAASGQVSTGQAAQVTSDILRGFGFEASKAGEVSDVLAKAAANSSVGVADLGNSFKYIGPVASAAGISFHETAAALEILGNAGIRGEKAGTGLQQMLNDLINPSKKAAETLNDLGIKTVDAHGAMLPLPVIIQQFTEAQKNAASPTEFLAQATQIWGQRTSDVLPLITAGGEALVKETEALKNAKGAAEEMGNALMNNLKGSTDQLMGSIETLGITLFQSFGPALKSATDFATGLVNKAIDLAKWFGEAPQWVQTTVLGLGTVAAAIGPVTFGLGQLMLGWEKLAPVMTLGGKTFLTVAGNVGTFFSMVKEFGVLSTFTAAFPSLSGAVASAGTAISGFLATLGIAAPPIGVVVAAVAALGAAAVLLWKNWDNVWPILKGLWKDISNIASSIFGGLAKWLGELWNGIASTASSVWGGIVKYLGGIWGPLMTVIETAWNGVSKFLSTLWDGIKSVATTVWNAIVSTVKWAVDKLATFFPETAKAFQDWGKHADAAKDSTDKLKTATINAESPTKNYKAALAQMNEALGGATGSRAQLDAAAKEMGKAEQAARNLDDAKEKLHLKIAKVNFETGNFIATLDKKWNLDSLDNTKKASDGLEKSIENVDKKIFDLSLKFGSNMNPEIKATVLHLELAKDRLEKLRDVAVSKEMAQIDQWAADLNKELAKTPPLAQAIPPEIVKMVEQGIVANMEKAGESFKTAGGILRKELSPEPLKTPWGDFGTKVFGEQGILPNFLLALNNSKGGIQGIANVAGQLPGQLKDAFMGTVVKGAFTELDKHFKGLGTSLSGIINSSKEWKEKIKDIGSTFLTFVVNQGINAAIKQMTLFEGGLKNLGKNISGIFKGLNDQVGSLTSGVNKLVTGTASGLPVSTPGGTPGAPGSGGLPGGFAGIAGPLTAIFTGIDAIFSGLSYFTERRMEKDIGRIEVSTRESAADLANLRTDQWTQYNGMYDRLGELKTITEEALGNIFDRLGELITAARENLNASVAGFGLVGTEGGGFELPEGASGGTGGIRDVYITVTGNTIQNDEELAALIMDQIFSILPTA